MDISGFDLVLDASHVEEPKPDKAAYALALVRLDEQPEDCVAIEDNVGGVQSATAAGLSCVAFPNANTAGHSFEQATDRVDRLEFAGLRSLTAPRLTRRHPHRHGTRNSHVQRQRDPRGDRVVLPRAGDTRRSTSAWSTAGGSSTLENTELADTYRYYGRCLMVIDEAVRDLHGERIDAYFGHHGIELTVFAIRIGEQRKTLRTVETIVDAFADFGLLRKEPVLVVGGGLTTDVAGFACASYRRSTNYIRIPTTLIGLIDASVSIKVAVNHGKHKNRLGAYHASQKVLLDFSLLETLPEDQVRNGMAELIKIAVVANAEHLRPAGEVRRGAAPHPVRPPRRQRPAASRPPTRSPTRRSGRCSPSRCPTCTSSTSTG